MKEDIEKIEEINQVELEKIDKELEHHFARFPTPPVSDERLEATIKHVQSIMEEKESASMHHLMGTFWNEIKFSNKLLLLIQLVILCSSMVVFNIASHQVILGFIFCVAPPSMVLGLTECLKSRGQEVSELELTFKYGTGQLFVVRLIIGLLFHAFTFAPLVISMGLMNKSQVISLLLVWFVPAFSVAVLCLGLSLYFPHSWNIVPFMLVIWTAGSILAITYMQVLEKFLGLSWIVHSGIIISLLTIISYLINKYQGAYANGIEDPISQ